MKVFAALFSCVLAVSSARMAYQFSDGYLEVLGAEPVPNFDCSGRSYGYYADVPTDCRVFHICLPIGDDLGEIVETAHFSFICPNQTVFNQETLTCSHLDDTYPCDQAESLFDVSNADFGRIPEENF